LQFPPAVSPAAHDLITRIVVKDPDARLGSYDTSDWKQHEFFRGTVFKDAHAKPPPVLTLTDLCLRHIGSNASQADLIEKWAKADKLSEDVRKALERMDVVRKWADKAMPPQDDA